MAKSPKQVAVSCILRVIDPAELENFPVGDYADGKMNPVKEQKIKEQLVRITEPLRKRLMKIADKYDLDVPRAGKKEEKDPGF